MTEGLRRSPDHGIALVREKLPIGIGKTGVLGCCERVYGARANASISIFGGRQQRVLGIAQSIQRQHRLEPGSPKLVLRCCIADRFDDRQPVGAGRIAVVHARA